MTGILYKKKRIVAGLDAKFKRMKRKRVSRDKQTLAVVRRKTNDGNSQSIVARLFAQSERRVTRSAKMKARNSVHDEMTQSAWV